MTLFFEIISLMTSWYPVIEVYHSIFKVFFYFHDLVVSIFVMTNDVILYK